MRQILLVSLYGILMSDIMLNLGLTLAPGLSLKNAFLYILFIGLVAEFSIGGRDFLRETWALHSAWLMLIVYATFSWLVITLLGIHRGYDALGGFIALKGRLVDLFLFLLVYLYGPRDIKGTINLLRWLIVIFVFVNVITLVDVFNIPNLGIIEDRTDGRLTGPVNEVNQYGAILIFIIPITAGLALASKGALKLTLGVGTLVAFVLLGLTVSRGSYFGLMAGGIVALYLVRDHVRKDSIVRGFLAIMVVVALAAAAILYLNPEGFMAKFDVADATLYGASSGRTFFWRQALTMMSTWPYSFVTGLGWDAYTVLFRGYGDPHNTYLLYWFNIGIPGLGLYLFIATWVVRYAVNCLDTVSKDIKPIVIGFVIGFLALHVALFFVSVFTPWLFIWAIAGTILRLVVENKRVALSEAANAATQEAE